MEVAVSFLYQVIGELQAQKRALEQRLPALESQLAELRAEVAGMRESSQTAGEGQGGAEPGQVAPVPIPPQPDAWASRRRANAST